jgi:acid phosphatase
VFNSPRLFLFLFIASVASFCQTLPAFKHVFVVVEENNNYSSVIGNSSMPYLNSLANTYGLATQYYADTHPSIGNYFMLTTGKIITNNDSFTGTVTADNVVRHLLTAGKTWKSYEESLPYAGYLQPDTGNYARRHCPLSYFSDVVNSSSEKLNLVPFTQFSSDLASGHLPSYSFITPNLCNDAHNCSLATADAWLKKNIAPLISSSVFKDGGLLIIVFDESANDNTHGGGRVAWVAVSSEFSKLKYKSTKLYQHQNTLRLTLQGLGLNSFPGAAASASDMSEFFK